MLSLALQSTITATLLSVLLLAASGVSAAPAPAEQAKQAEAVNYNSRFTCPDRVNSFCRASNIHSGCTSNNEFRSDAMDTCGECKC
ncbi:hypothetical protein JDV02_003075 [Purpureocillium takamizusanense]|uniref:Uncharacterized protein n=1 Tax=Purpureocillium takamizusanense TaxID=2060973 RepID=A0A9Q8QAT6_9HYPO|nr:uncharacterized protein JDV02_003075 [Purpureocillium takamizusanense]UNI16658.1 hypothetical protein JDV02_003075 [Purpureocillium takamizusanense]